MSYFVALYICPDVAVQLTQRLSTYVRHELSVNEHLIHAANYGMLLYL